MFGKPGNIVAKGIGETGLFGGLFKDAGGRCSGFAVAH